MNKGLYKEGEYYYFYKFWENSSKNFGVTFVLESDTEKFIAWDWKNWIGSGDPQLIGAACLAQW